MLLNITVLAVVLLIAYWWASQGFFSSLLHLATVLVAGAFAFAFWEPVAVWAFGRINNVVLNDMAWGISLLVIFGLVIQLLRPLTIRACPANTALSETVNLIGGGVLGLGAGIIVSGILLIGIQYIQGPTELLGAQTWKLDIGGSPEKQDDFWLDTDEWTSEFYSSASLGPLWSPNPLAKWHPDLHQAAGLYRQSFDDGKSRMGINADAFTVEWIKQMEATTAQQVVADAGSVIDTDRQTRGGQADVYQVRTLFNTAAWDAGNKLHIMRTQVRLVVRTPDGEYLAVHPHAFIEPIRQDTADEGRWLWDDPQTAATSVGSPERAPITFEFAVPAQSTVSHMIVRQGRIERADMTQAPEALTMSDVQRLNQAAASVESAPPGDAITSAKPWQGYLMMFLLAVFVVYSNMMPAKRGHQD